MLVIVFFIVFIYCKNNICKVFYEVRINFIKNEIYELLLWICYINFYVYDCIEMFIKFSIVKIRLLVINLIVFLRGKIFDYIKV